MENENNIISKWIIPESSWQKNLAVKIGMAPNCSQASFLLQKDPNINFFSNKTLIKSLLPPHWNQEQKLKRLYDFVCQHTKNETPVFDNSKQYHDPIQMICQFGNGWCDDINATLLNLAKTADISGRMWTTNGHVFPEFNIDGNWKLADASFSIYPQVSFLEFSNSPELQERSYKTSRHFQVISRLKENEYHLLENFSLEKGIPIEDISSYLKDRFISIFSNFREAETSNWWDEKQYDYSPEIKISGGEILQFHFKKTHISNLSNWTPSGYYLKSSLHLVTSMINGNPKKVEMNYPIRQLKLTGKGLIENIHPKFKLLNGTLLHPEWDQGKGEFEWHIPNDYGPVYQGELKIDASVNVHNLQLEIDCSCSPFLCFPQSMESNRELYLVSSDQTLKNDHLVTSLYV